MWQGKVAFIDLDHRSIKIKEIPKPWRRLFLGGRGINVYMLYSLAPPRVDAFSPENPMIVGVGMLTGITALGAGRTNITAKSPLTGALGDSNIGGHIGLALRRSGFDHLIIRGKAEKPVVIWAHDGCLEIKDAEGIWGMDALEAQEALRKDFGEPGLQSIVIGPAGERLVRFANIRTGRKSSAGRTGMGAVMGSKGVKAICASGNMKIEFYDADSLFKYCKELNEMIMRTKWGQAQHRYGTMAIFNHTYYTGLLRVRNFQDNYLPDVGTLEPENIEKYSVGQTGCSACVIKCRHVYELNGGPFPHRGEGPEYSQLGSFGTMVGCNSMEVVMNCAHLCNKYGLDTIETGNMVAWVMELYERGLIKSKDADGLELRWGEEEVLYELIRKIAFREGIGDTLAEGINKAVEVFGEEARYYALQVKGMGWILSDDRPVPSFALGMAVATRGADHLRSRPALDLYGLPEDLLEKLYGGKVPSDYTSYEGKGRMIWWHELLYAVIDSLGLCKFQTVFCAVHAPAYEEWSKLIEYAAGLKLSKEDLMDIGERIYTLERLFNIREGFGKKDDYPPERMFVEAMPSGLARVKGRKLDRMKYEEMLAEYYRLHGWDAEGAPTQEAIKRLGIGELPMIGFEA